MWDDVLRRIWPDLPESRNVLITKGLVVLFGLISMALAFSVSYLGGTVIRSMLSFAAAIGAPTTAMFLMGILLPFVNGKGATVGGLVGFSLALWVAFGSYTIKSDPLDLGSPIDNCSAYLSEYRPHLLSLEHLSVNTTTPTPGVTTTLDNPVVITGILYQIYSISFLWYGMYSMIISFVVGIIVSLLTGRTVRNYPEARLLHPWIRCYAINNAGNEHEKGYQESSVTENGIRDLNIYTEKIDSHDKIIMTKM